MILFLRYFQCFFQFHRLAHPLSYKKRNSREEKSPNVKPKIKHVSILSILYCCKYVVFAGGKPWFASKSGWCLETGKNFIPPYFLKRDFIVGVSQ